MQQRFLFLFFVTTMAFAQNENATCNKSSAQKASKIEAKIKKGFGTLWQEVDNKVGVEFFLLVLKGNDRMPSSELDQASYYKELLTAMKRTSKELAMQGMKFDPKNLQKVEGLIDDLDREEKCQSVVSL